MNRPPGPRDPWWPQHQADCGGTYTKVKEPDGYGKKKEKKTEETVEKAGKKKSPESVKGVGKSNGVGKSADKH
jgi:hypothetical protein